MKLHRFNMFSFGFGENRFIGQVPGGGGGGGGKGPEAVPGTPGTPGKKSTDSKSEVDRSHEGLSGSAFRAAQDREAGLV